MTSTIFENKNDPLELLDSVTKDVDLLSKRDSHVTPFSKSPNPQIPHIPLVPSASSAGATAGKVVTLPSKGKKGLESKGRNRVKKGKYVRPANLDVTVDCDTLSAMELRRRYEWEANSHRNMLLRITTENALVDPRFYSFRDFLRLVRTKPSKEFTLDRIVPTDPEYAPGKVRWLNKQDQANNRSNTLTFRSPEGRDFHSHELAKRQKVSIVTIRQRKLRGWTDAEIIAGERLPLLPTVVGPSTPNLPEVPPLEGAWRKAMAAAYPTKSAALSGADRGMLKHWALLCRQEYLGDRAAEILEHTIKHWFDYARIGVQYGYGLKDYPNRPTLGLILRYPRPAVDLWLEANKLDMRDFICPEPQPQYQTPIDPLERDNL